MSLALPRSLRAALAVAALLVADARAQVIVSGDCNWPIGCGYTGTSSVPVPIFGPSVGIRNLRYVDLPPCTPTPGSGTYTIDSFFDVFYEITLDGGGTWTPRYSPGTGKSQQVPTSPPASNPRVFDTEMLQLELQGGTAPPGMRLRESPTLPSPGHMTLEDVGGGSFRIDSFFDVFFELSLDGGQSWTPANQPYRLALTQNPPTSVRRASWSDVKSIYR